VVAPLATEEEVEAVAKALRGHFLDLARAVIEKIPFDPLDLEAFIEKLLSESDTARVLIFASYLDDRIQNLLMLQMLHLESQASIERLFGINGPLGTFSRRVLIAYHLGWITDDTKQKLDAFRKVRNDLAHRAFKVTVSDPQIAGQLAAFDASSQGIYQSLQQKLSRPFTPNLLCDLVLLAWRVFEELLIFPVARSFLVIRPKDLSIASDDPPEVLKRVLDQTVRGLLVAGGLGKLEKSNLVSDCSAK
jgi:DNA-binding MltR family transcriptional regulator